MLGYLWCTSFFKANTIQNAGRRFCYFLQETRPFWMFEWIPSASSPLFFFFLCWPSTMTWTHNDKLKVKLARPENKSKGLWCINVQECQPLSHVSDVFVLKYLFFNCRKFRSKVTIHKCQVQGKIYSFPKTISILQVYIVWTIVFFLLYLRFTQRLSTGT